MSGDGYRQQSHRREYRETTADTIFDDVCLVAFLSGELTQSATLGIGDGHDAASSLFVPYGLFQLLAQQAESNGRFGGGTALGYDNDAETTVVQILLQFVQIVFGDVMSGKTTSVVFRPIGGMRARVHG